MDELRFSTKVMIIQFPDAEYFGEILNEKREGQGIIKYKSGRVYEGHWKNGLRHGEGEEIFSNLNRFQGRYFKGKPEGQGIYYWKTGEIYEGSWKNGLKHGYGIFKGSNNECYIGEWKNSKPHGRGVSISSKGEKYEGDFENGLKHGNGSYFYCNGDILIGKFRFGETYGVARYIWKDGSNYIGNLLNGKKNGYGKWNESLNNKGNSYEGYYQNDKKHGYGVYSWKSGNKYKGQFYDDERHGIGKMKWRDGTIYLGQWVKGIQNGFGKINLSNGEIKEGIFIDNNYKGPASPSQIPDVLKNKDFSIENLNPQKFSSLSNDSVNDFKIKQSKNLISKTTRNINDKSLLLTEDSILASFEIKRSFISNNNNNQNQAIGINFQRNSKHLNPQFENILDKSPYSRKISKTKLNKRKLANLFFVNKTVDKNDKIEIIDKNNEKRKWIPKGNINYSIRKESDSNLNKSWIKKNHHQIKCNKL